MSGLVKKFRELTVKYGRVAIGVHLSVSALSIAGCYVAIKNSLDVEGALEWVGLVSESRSKEASKIQHDMSHGDTIEVGSQDLPSDSSSGGFFGSIISVDKIKKIATGEGGPLALAFLCNKVLFPVRVPITLALTPRIHRYLRSKGFKV